MPEKLKPIPMYIAARVLKRWVNFKPDALAIAEGDINRTEYTAEGIRLLEDWEDRLGRDLVSLNNLLENWPPRSDEVRAWDGLVQSKQNMLRKVRARKIFVKQMIRQIAENEAEAKSLEEKLVIWDSQLQRTGQ